MGIRTPDTLLAHTRFPIVLLRPARTSLRFTICCAMLFASRQRESIAQNRTSRKHFLLAALKNHSRGEVSAPQIHACALQFLQSRPATARSPSQPFCYCAEEEVLESLDELDSVEVLLVEPASDVLVLEVELLDVSVELVLVDVLLLEVEVLSVDVLVESVLLVVVAVMSTS